MKILILGIDGYIGWPLALDLLEKGHTVYGIDSYVRRSRVEKVGSNSLTPISSIAERNRILREYENFPEPVAKVSLGKSPSYWMINILREFRPEAIIHLAEQPSAAYSMDSCNNAAETFSQNVVGTLHLLWAMKESTPDAHLIKLGTMGEYGTPDCAIPEGNIPNTCMINKNAWPAQPDCPMQGLPFPRQPGSFYHLTKVHDSYNIMFACKNWGFTSTDIMQGVVYGLIDGKVERLTRFDYDECFGTAINRFCAQAVSGMPITPYGEGNQQRGFIPLKDSLQCINIILNNPPKKGEYRTFNQFENVYSINELAEIVSLQAFKFNLKPNVTHIANPRNELENHYYNPYYAKLFELGYEPSSRIEKNIRDLLKTLLPFRMRVNKAAIMPTIRWS